MSDPRFARAFGKVVHHEGGLSLDPNDRGNWTSGKIGRGQLRGTKYGVSAMSYPDRDIANLTLDDVQAIYAAAVWTPAGWSGLPTWLAYAHIEGSR